MPNEIAGGFGHEQVVAQHGGKSVADVRGGTRGRRILRQPAVAQDAGLVAAIDTWRRVRRKYLDVGHETFIRPTECRLVRAAGSVALRHEVDVQRILVAVSVEAAVTVHRQSPLAQRLGLAIVEGATLRQPEFTRPIRVVNPVVHAPHEPVRVVLGIRGHRAVVVAHASLHVGLEVAIRVARDPEIRRLRDEHAVLQHLH